MIIDIPWAGDLNPGPRPRFREAVRWWRDQGIEVILCEAEHVPTRTCVLVSHYGVNHPTSWDTAGHWEDYRSVYRFYINESFKSQAMLFKLVFA
jgi:hypothetical protein